MRYEKKEPVGTEPPSIYAGPPPRRTEYTRIARSSRIEWLSRHVVRPRPAGGVVSGWQREAAYGRRGGFGAGDARLGESPEGPALCECDVSCLVLKLAPWCHHGVRGGKVRHSPECLSACVCTTTTSHPARGHSEHDLSLGPVLFYFPFPPVITGDYCLRLSRCRRRPNRRGEQLLRRGGGMRADHQPGTRIGR